MSLIEIKWDLREKNYDEVEKKHFSKFELNSEWFMIYWVSKTIYYVSVYIEIRHDCKSDEGWISGKLELQFSQNSKLYTEWENLFFFPFEPGCESQSIPVQYHHSRPCFLIVGYVIINDNIAKRKHVIPKINDEKDIQLQFLNELSNDLSRLLDPETASFEDVHLKCGSVAIPAHKNILSMRSPVFSAMFSSEMEETRKNEVDITDVDVPVLRMMLKYVYTGKVENLTVSSAGDLLYAADKYQLKGLKTRCSDYLKCTVSIENVLGILSLGDLLDPDLKMFAMDFICEKFDEFPALEKTEEWKNLEKEKMPLAFEVLMSLVKSKGK
ncbi:speckle-type POZ protein-like B [Nephila pilipes]|uniref:Speckle-type POZ protein-like B n=1 Tax=Nephila pilipes TaxID=299642 RepID=A0A8X6PMT4_NEPPI|nr:speckle-type POZ protein-like B [Nephila pilipes]